MAYEKQTWRCGDTITNTGLNHIEDGIKANDTAIANLQTQINNIDLGYDCVDTYALLFSGSITTDGEDEHNPARARVQLSRAFTGDEFPSPLKVTFNNVEYECTARGETSDGKEYGATVEYDAEQDAYVWNWSEYPFMFALGADSDDGIVYTENNGTYQMQIQYPSVEVETSECFEKAVKDVAGNDLVVGYTSSYDSDNNTQNYTLDKTCEEILNAYKSGRRVIVKGYGDTYRQLVYAESHLSCGGAQYSFGIVWDAEDSPYGYGSIPIWNFTKDSSGYPVHYVPREQ